MRSMLLAMSLLLCFCWVTAQAQTPQPRTPPDHDLQELAAQLNMTVAELEQLVAESIAKAKQQLKAERLREQHKKVQFTIVAAFIGTLLLLIAVKSLRISEITEARLQRSLLSVLAFLGSSLFLASSTYALLSGQIGIPRRHGGSSSATWENEPFFFLLSFAMKTSLGLLLLTACLRIAMGKPAFPKR